MDDQSNASAGPEFTSSSMSSPGSKRKNILVAVLIGFGFLVAIGLAFLVVNKGSETSKKAQQTTNAAENTLFTALEKAAAKQTIRAAVFRQTFATKADLQANTNPGVIQSSVAEIDAASGKYSHVYAQKMYDKTEFDMERCVQNVTFVDAASAFTGRALPTSLTAAGEYLKTMYKVTEPLQFIACPNVGVMPGLPPEMAPARLSDGIMPVTLQPAQAAMWREKLTASGLFTVKDEGMVTRDGRQLHKYSVMPKDNRADVNQKLYDIFYEAAEIAKVKQQSPKAKWEYGFLSINPNYNGSIQGFYLIDEKSGLPVYSELQGLHTDNTSDKGAAKATIGFNKQTYAYPASLTLNESSPLEILE